MDSDFQDLVVVRRLGIGDTPFTTEINIPVSKTWSDSSYTRK